MSRRLLNMNTNLGSSTASLPVDNPMELVKPKPVVVQNFVPNEPIILTKEQWEAVCSKTKDASVPFTVQITVINTEEEEPEHDDKINFEEVEKIEEVYIPKRVRKSKK